MSVTVVPIPGGRLIRHRTQALFPRYDKCLNSVGEYVEKLLNASCRPTCSIKYIYIYIYIKLGFVSVNGPGETYLVDALHILLNKVEINGIVE